MSERHIVDPPRETYTAMQSSGSPPGKSSLDSVTARDSSLKTC